MSIIYTILIEIDCKITHKANWPNWPKKLVRGRRIARVKGDNLLIVHASFCRCAHVYCSPETVDMSHD